MNILFAVSEAEPYVKTGGLADVAGNLPRALAKRGHRLILFLPLYQEIRLKNPALAEVARVTVPLGAEPVPGVVLEKVDPDFPGCRTFFIRQDDFFDRPHLYGPPGEEYPDNGPRFIFFCRAILEAVKQLGLEIDIYHAHDWQTALLPVYLKTLYRDLASASRAASLFTIHNLGYQGIQEKEIFPLTGLDWSEFTYEKLEYYDRLNLLKGGLVYADILNTVSPTYSREILQAEFGFGLEGVLQQRRNELFGILNGVDYDIWDPAVDPYISPHYRIGRMSGKKRCKEKLLQKCGLPVLGARPLVGMVSRLVNQKGFDLILELLDAIDCFDCAFFFLGTGEKEIEKQLADRARACPEKISFICDYDNRLAHQLEAGADIFLMPSAYEPCGLNQLYSLRYGTVPLVRAVGGLNDSITDFNPTTGRGNGFKFFPYTTEALAATLERALSLYRKPRLWWKLRGNGMRCDFSWAASARQYEELYRRMQGLSGKPAKKQP